MLSPGVETWSKSLLKVGFARKARVPLGLQDQTPQSLASGLDAMGLTPWPNHIIQYMNLYLQTNPELLVMSLISSETPNNI